VKQLGDVLSLQELAIRLEQESAETVIKFAVEQYPRLTLACSFGAEDVVLVDMLHSISPKTEIFYLDTNVHFAETYDTRDRLSVHYGVEFVQVLPELTLEEQAEKFGEELWKSDPNACCRERKVKPLTNHLLGFDAWITGIRREQSPTRANAKKIEWDAIFGLWKFNPLADWTNEDVWTYIHYHHIPYNALHDHGYPSIGCMHCTRQVAAGEDARAGRWSGFEKTECGLHRK